MLKKLSYILISLLLCCSFAYAQDSKTVTIIDEGRLMFGSPLSHMEALVAYADINKHISESEPERTSYITYLLESLNDEGYKVKVVTLNAKDVYKKMDESKKLISQSTSDYIITTRWALTSIKNETYRLTMDVSYTFDMYTKADKEKSDRAGEYVYHKEDWFLKEGDKKKEVITKARKKTAEKLLIKEDALAREVVEWLESK